MRLQNLFEQIESVQFSAYIGVISGFRILLQALEDNASLQALIDDIKDAPKHQELVLRRLKELLATEGEPGYQHPYDAAITGYIYALMKADDVLGDEAARKVSENQQLWWAAKLAEYILKGMQPSKA